MIEGEYGPLRARGITEETCRKFGYQTGYDSKHKKVHIASYYDANGDRIGQKLRYKSKDFAWLGEPKKATLFGQKLWKQGGKKLVITEGEIDAMTVSQLQGNKWPVVSVQNGAQGAAKSVLKEIEWVESFDEVVLMFDQDDPGKEAALEVAQALSPGKAKIASLPYKDANECLTEGEGGKVIDAVWQAREWRPDEIVSGEDLWEDIISYDPNKDSIETPWVGLNEMTLGLRKGELWTLAAGSGIGKSTLCRELCHHLLVTKEQTIGYIALEESVERSARGVMSVHTSKPLHIRTDVDEEELREAFEATVGSGRWFGYRHFGSMEAESLYSRIRYMVVGCGCDYVFLDHLSIVVSGISDGDERRNIDAIMTSLRSMVEELGFGLILVSHLKRTDGTPLEEGGKTHLGLLRGSAAIGQLSDMVVGFERDQQDEERKHVTTIRILKNRFSGDTGEACELSYDKETGRLSEKSKEGGEF